MDCVIGEELETHIGNELLTVDEMQLAEFWQLLGGKV